MRKDVRKGDSGFFITSTAIGDLGDADHWPVSRELMLKLLRMLLVYLDLICRGTWFQMVLSVVD